MMPGQLQADDHEQRGVHDEHRGLPERVGLDARARGDELRRAPAEVDPGRHGGEHRGDAERLGREVGEVGRDQGDRDLRRRVLDPAAQLGDQEAHEDPDRDPAGRADHEVERRVRQRERPRHDGRDRELVDDEARGIVDEALPLDDRHVTPRCAEPAGDRGRRDRVGRGDDRAEHERHIPGQARNHVRHPADDDRRDDHEADRQQRDRLHVRAQLVQIAEERRRIEQRRQRDDEDDRRVDLEVGDARHEAQQRAADDEDDRVRDARAVRDHEHRGDGDQQAECDELVAVHVSAARASPRPAPRRPPGGRRSRCPRRWWP